ncbi:MAG: chromosome segregation protein SMC [Bdellovibrionaceae bacterium]|nr:chromosome segregation protein SMC [Pseudobdellovibrionaceae bacterium]
MRIKKLELIGFKSFKDRTVIHFDQGITGIVGPNGCGKSNIVDALVWVMGEMSAKHLRGSSMSDVIFAGADGYAPLGMAEVSLTLENDGGPFPVKYSKFSEVMVTRRLHKSGDSEYLINKEPARLRDIQEIFMDTGAGSKGFSIIEQGAIGKIITAKPEDRRTLIEEAAGITKFKVRKRESQRKLQSTDQNLVRLQDILTEQKRQLGSLERQAQRAERYRNIKRDLQEKDMIVSSKNYMKIHEETETLGKELETLRESEGQFGSEISQKETLVEELRLKITEMEKETESFQVEQGESQEKVQKLEYEIRELQFEMEQARRNREMTGSILEQSQARKQILEKEIGELNEALETAKVDSENLGTQYKEESAKYESIQTRIHAVDEELIEKRREMFTVSQSETHLEARQQGLDDKLSEQSERLDQIRQIGVELSEQKTQLETRRNELFKDLEKERQLQLDIMKDVENFQENVDLLKKQRDEKLEEVSTFKDQLNEVASRLYGLENLQANFEGFEEGVKQVMLWQRSQMDHPSDAPSMKPVAELVEVPEKYELAMEAALGQKLQLLVADSSDKALGAVDFLKEGHHGRSSFVASDWSGMQTVEQVTWNQIPGVIAPLKDVVKIPEKQQKVIAQFFEDVVVVDSIRNALSLRAQYPNRTFVTLDGDCLSHDGVLTGGSSEGAESGLLKRRREIKDLSQKREEMSGKLSLAQLSLKKLEDRLTQVSEELELSKKRQVEKEVQIAELKKDYERSEVEFKNSQVAVERHQNELNKEEATLARLEQDLAEVQERLTEMREQRLVLESVVADLEKEFQESKAGVADLQKRVTQLQMDFTSKSKEVENLQSKVDMISHSLSEVGEQVSKMSQESQASTETLSTHQVLIEQRKRDLEVAIQNLTDLKQLVSEKRNEYEKKAAELRQIETEVNEQNRTRSQNQMKTNELQLKLEQLRMKEQYIVDQIHERYMLVLSDVASQYTSFDGDLSELEKEVSELKSKLSRIGEVNLSSIEEYEDLQERHQFLDQQYKDLIESKEQLRRVIDRINRICTRRFKETFELVNERFTKVFPVLFGGGEARLILVEDPENGEMGIDIVSKPPGKKLQNVSLLSGGEKALTAVSLIFSIFLVKPSPFCLLDEVDAPLDDANVFRFNDLVKEMAKRSQIIIVTHNKHTMKVNNVLYGVTMEEKGVSKMVSVSLDQAQKVV